MNLNELQQMDCVEIHRFIWDYVIWRFEQSKGNLSKYDIFNAKKQVVEMLYGLGAISREAYGMLSDHSCCVACTVYNHCCDCCLFDYENNLACDDKDSEYAMACSVELPYEQRLKAMWNIRDWFELNGNEEPEYLELFDKE